VCSLACSQDPNGDGKLEYRELLAKLKEVGRQAPPPPPDLTSPAAKAYSQRAQGRRGVTASSAPEQATPPLPPSQQLTPSQRLAMANALAEWKGHSSPLPSGGGGQSSLAGKATAYMTARRKSSPLPQKESKAAEN
jgi:hypothetical protein